MKKWIMSAMMLAAVATGAFAQPATNSKDAGVKHERHQKKRMMSLHQLNLTKAQKDQMKSDRKEFQSKMTTLNADGNQTVKQFRKGRAALMEEQKARFEGILTPEQKAKLSESKAQAGHHSKEHLGHSLDKMKESLQLSDGQVATLRTKNKAVKTQMKRLKDNSELTAEAKKDQVKVLREEMKKNLETVLTSEQKQKFESLKSTRKEKMGVK